MKKILVKFISGYQFFSKYLGILPHRCVFIPTCSEYTKEAITQFGPLKGTVLGFKRISRCHPWQANHYDPLPDKS